MIKKKYDNIQIIILFAKPGRVSDKDKENFWAICLIFAVHYLSIDYEECLVVQLNFI